MNNRSAISPLTLLGIMFIGLKLADIIHWSWWLVTLPFSIWFVIHFIVLLMKEIKNASD